MADENKKTSQQYKSNVVDLKKEVLAEKKLVANSEEGQKKANNNVVRSENKSARVFFSWTVKDSAAPPKGPLWYTIAFIVVAILIISSIVQKNWLFMALIILAVFAYFNISKRDPLNYEIRVSDEGVEIGKDFFYFNRLKGFGFFVKRGKDFFILETDSFTQKLLVLPLKVNKDKLGDFLIKYLPEKEYEESFSDMLREILKF